MCLDSTGQIINQLLKLLFSTILADLWSAKDLVSYVLVIGISLLVGYSVGESVDGFVDVG